MSVRSLTRSGLVNFVETRSMLVGNEAFVISGDYELISTEILTSSQSSITFSNLGDYSSTYKHLQIRLAARTDSSEGLSFRLNGDTGSNYRNHFLVSVPPNVLSGDKGSTSLPDIAQVADSSAPSNAFGATVIDILDPYSATKNTTLRSLAGALAFSPRVVLFSAFYNNTSSITSIQLLPSSGSGNLIAGSRFSLYGIRG
jgi:hypothetical protein